MKPSALTSARVSALALSRGVSIQHNYSALHPDLYTPPDTHGAAGPNSCIENVNQTIAVYSSRTTGPAGRFPGSNPPGPSPKR